MSRNVRVLVVVFALVGCLWSSSPTVIADTNGDLKDELGAFAVEVTGSARGAWYQIHNAAGVRMANVFLGNDYTAYQLLTLDTNGDGIDEAIILRQRISDGFINVQVRSTTGALLASTIAVNGDFSNHKLFAINYNGGAAVEMGIGMVDSTSGMAYYRVFNRVGANINLLKSHWVTPGMVDHYWDAADFDNDGQDEVFQAFTDGTTSFSAYRVWNPRNTTLVGARWVSNATASAHQWKLGNFDGSRTGVEILHGFVDGSGNGLWQIMDEVGSLINSRLIAINTWTGFQWETIAGAGGFDLIFAGYQSAADGTGQFQVWNGQTNTRVGIKSLTFSTKTVVEWVVGNFDWNAANGDEVAVGYSRNSDGFIGMAVANKPGTLVWVDQIIFNSSFVNPQFLAIDAYADTSDSVFVGAQVVGGRPILRLYNGVTGVKQMEKYIFNSDVV